MCTHASGESVKDPLPLNTHAVVLEVQNELELLKLSLILTKEGIQHILVREPDSPYLNQAMAIGITPCLKSKVKKYLSKYPLLKGE